jgi:hypothetical protein
MLGARRGIVIEQNSKTKYSKACTLKNSNKSIVVFHLRKQ